ncbi:MAG: hypothetical protein BMS9Abin33_0315 [Gammaproteobacteria bacterium]|nr:MAG: hypothetical protein BMS9Abin33_0315 [Gammaproteobacteria bacterium]
MRVVRPIFLMFLAINGADASDNKHHSRSSHPQPIHQSNRGEININMGMRHATPHELGLTRLMEAVNKGDLAETQKLLDQGVNINAVSKSNSTALTLAVNKGHLAIAHLLLERGANPDHAGYLDQTALIMAVRKGYRKTVKLLLEKGANARHRPSIWNDNTALEYATMQGNIELVKLIIPHIDAKTDLTIALLNAVSKGHEAITHILLESGADPNKPSRSKKRRYRDYWDNMYPLHYAISNNNIGVVKQLLKYGADINQKGGWHNSSPLSLAVSAGRAELAELLLKNGASVAVMDNYDNTVMDIAKAKNNMDMIALLKKYKAADNTPELERFFPSGIVALSGLAKSSNKHDYIKKVLGEPLQVITLEDNYPTRDVLSVEKRKKWLYEGLHFILTTEKYKPQNKGIEYIELSNSKYELTYGLQIGQHKQRFMDRFGTPANIQDGELMYRIRKDVDGFTSKRTMILKLDNKGNVHTISWRYFYTLTWD